MDYDYGARVKNKANVDEIVFASKKRLKQSFAAPPYDDYSLDANGQTVIQLLSTSAGQYVPIKMSASDLGPQLHVADTNVNEWANLKRREAREMFKNEEHWFIRILPYLMIMVVGASMAVMGIIMFQEAPKVMSQMATVAEKMYQTSLVLTGTNVATSGAPLVG